MPINVRGMIEMGPSIHESLTPVVGLFTGNVDADRRFAILSFVSGRREQWEVFSCLLGFLEDRGAELASVVRNIRLETLTSGQPEHVDAQLAQYCAERISSIPFDRIIGAIYSSALVLGALTPHELVTLQGVRECIVLNTNPDGSIDVPGVLRCMRGGQ